MSSEFEKAMAETMRKSKEMCEMLKNISTEVRDGKNLGLSVEKMVEGSLTKMDLAQLEELKKWLVENPDYKFDYIEESGIMESVVRTLTANDFLSGVISAKKVALADNRSSQVPNNNNANNQNQTHSQNSQGYGTMLQSHKKRLNRSDLNENDRDEESDQAKEKDHLLEHKNGEVRLIVEENPKKQAAYDALLDIYTASHDKNVTGHLLIKTCSLDALKNLGNYLDEFKKSDTYAAYQALIESLQAEDLLKRTVEKLEHIHTMSTRAVFVVMILLVLSFGVGVGALWLGQAYPFNFANKEATLFKVIALVGIPLVLLAVISAIWTYWAMFLEPQKIIEVAAEKVQNKAVYGFVRSDCGAWLLWFLGIVLILIYMYSSSGMYIAGSFYAHNPSAKFWNLLYSEIWWVLPIAIYGVSFVIWLVVFMLLSYRVRLIVKAAGERLFEEERV